MTGLRLKIGKLFSKQCLRDWRKFNEKKRWLGKKELLHNWLRGKKLLTFSKINLLFFFEEEEGERKNEVCRFGSRVFYIQSWPCCFRVTSKVVHFYFVSFPSFDFFRIQYIHGVRSSIVREFRISSSPFNPLLIPFTRFIPTHLVLLSLLEENFKFHHQTLPTKNPNHCSIFYIFNKFNFYQRTKKHRQNC